MVSVNMTAIRESIDRHGHERAYIDAHVGDVKEEGDKRVRPADILACRRHQQGVYTSIIVETDSGKY